MWTVAKLEVEDLRWSWFAIALGAGILGLLVLPPIHLFFLAAMIGFVGMTMFSSRTHRAIGATFASIGLGMLIPAAAALVLQGINSL
ncbi:MULTISPECIES: hypothetical protein [Rhodococcus]|jgi:hypothetical protein|uniref:Uncharacterized protein n=1 Tax=Rhodococcus oxybenzonivorans TaxID=1990687 RepID=A0AAE5A405_9NOCA|nr:MULTISPECIES: hypothetical protein [Rhodococcus]MDV7244218.1 hypothetical protein [Rhodococcus oxybenzonivorans]MDV7263001.1 hypothetical protein [Rhodococcus oxybenzonivorans]MDV7274540.1 hypothetical protein [Rhodococcus oxybenzonivorans]MDV7335853.1 hypothetical protein [Rhodococcus oxybenzonivorans]MDV7345490.1 hypothetical protein [Rhodococcus oxybenzonivorans]